DKLEVNGNGVLKGLVADTANPIITITSPAAGAFINETSVNVTGTFSDESFTTIMVNGVVADIVINN
ncbi:MAG: hypothetical protein HYZ43_13895, partial [Flavobacteriia bacterium]|nr:hypothetical protein [Flavobacteriia bacterium]